MALKCAMRRQGDLGAHTSKFHVKHGGERAWHEETQEVSRETPVVLKDDDEAPRMFHVKHRTPRAAYSARAVASRIACSASPT